jgi:hypothetical protein
MGSCAAPSAKGDDKFITTDYLQQCPISSNTVVNAPSKQNMSDCVSQIALSPKSSAPWPIAAPPTTRSIHRPLMAKAIQQTRNGPFYARARSRCAVKFLCRNQPLEKVAQLSFAAQVKHLLQSRWALWLPPPIRISAWKKISVWRQRVATMRGQ